MSRRSQVERTTSETTLFVDVELDGGGRADVSTGVGFFDHMLHQLARHGGFDLTVRADGDLHIDAHHTVEDVAIALGTALDRALGDKAGVRRYADATVPLDEALARAVVDLSGRPYVVHEEATGLAPMIGTFPASLNRHFWESFGHNARITLHVDVLRAARPGAQPDAHHVVEAQFKAVARALHDAVQVIDPTGRIPSTKGVL